MEYKINKKNLFFHFLIAYLILSCGGVMLGDNETVIVGFFFLILVSYIVKKRITLSLRRSLLLSILIGSVILTSLVNFTGFQGNMINFIFGFILKIINAFLVAHIIPDENFKRIYISQIYILSIISLLFYFSFLIYPDLKITLPNLGQDKVYTNYGVYLYLKPYYNLSPRNTSIFYEPGVFQGIVNLSLIFLLADERVHKTKYLIVFIVTILTTFSTTGVIVLPVILFTFFLRDRRYVILTTISALLILVFSLSKVEYFEKTVINKLSNSDNSSSIRRFSDILNEVSMFKESPIVGNGYNFFTLKEKFLNRSDIDETWVGSTNSITYHLALFGILFMFPVLYTLIVFCTNHMHSYFYGLIIFGSLLLILMGEGFLQKMLFLCLIFYGIPKLNYTKLNDRLVKD